ILQRFSRRRFNGPSVKNGRRPFRCTSALPQKAEVHPRSCYVARVPEGGHGRHSLNGTLWNISPGSRGSLRLDAGGLDHLAPFLGFVGDQTAKVDGPESEHVATEVS